MKGSGFVDILLLFTFLIAVSYCQTPFCQVTTPAPNSQSPGLPKLPDSFQTQIEANFVDLGYTIDIQEFFDNTGNQGALYMVEDGEELIAIFDYDTNEFFQITGDIGCVVSNLSDPTSNVIFGETTVDGQHHIFTTGGALRFGSTFGENYKGQTQVRGINVDHWQSCVYWKPYDAYFTVDYYFTMKNWTSGIDMPQTPVRAWVQGTGTNPVKTFNHYYDFFAFRPAVQELTMFETPKGTVCPGRLVTKSLPKLAGQYYYRQEIITPLLSVVQQADVWYDSSYNLVRYDYRYLSASAPYFDTNPFTEIHDYNSGVAYVIDRILGNCTVTTIENTTFDATLNYTATVNSAQFYDQIKSSLGLFYLDDTYSYEGQRTVSGMNCDVFISQRTDYQVPGFGAVNSTFEYHFLSEEWTEIANPGVSVDTTVPIRLEINVPSIGFNVYYNFYDFDEEHPSLDNFDISPCYDLDATIDFQLNFKGKYYPIIDSNKKLFELNTRLKMSALIKVSPLRIQKSAIKYDSGNVYYLATLMDAPPAKAQFHRFPQAVLEHMNDKQIPNEGNADICAYYCMAEASFSCQSFDVCTSKNICYLSKSTADDGNLVANDGCDHYSRNVKQPAFAESSLGDAFAALKDVVYRNMFKFDIPLGNEQKKTYIVNSVRQNIIRADLNSVSQLSGADYMKQFIATRNKAIVFNNDHLITQVSVDDCATACVDEDSFICQSFEYNVVNGDCHLSKLHPAEHKDFIKDSPNIDLYERSYLYKFTKTPGVVMLSESNVIYQAIKDRNLCAKLCADLQEFTCKSFEYCDDIQGCILGQTHQLDIPENKVKSDPSCDHYSRNYIDDFKFLQGKVIALTNNQVIEDVTVGECAKICADQGNDCLGFDYCGNDTLCRTTSDSVKNTGVVTIETSAYCDHYSRQYYEDGSQVTSHSLKNAQDPSLKFTSGAMAAVAMSMIVVGILLAVGISFCWSKINGKPNWNPSTKLENMN